MKKKIFDNVDFSKVRKAIKNSLDEDGEKLKNALLDFITEIEESETEYSAQDFEELIKAKFDELKGEATSSAEEAVANALAKRIADVQNGIKKDLPIAVKNQVACAILRSQNKNEVANNVEAVLVKNGISGFTFNDVIDFTIVEKWGDFSPLYKKFHQTMYTKFFYNTDTLMTAKGILAKQWGSAEVAEKVIQSLSVTGKQITTAYVYKRQQVALADLDEIEIAGENVRFINWLYEELMRQVINTIIMAILIGDSVNDVNDRLSTFETIGTKATSDAFTSVSTATASTPTVAEVRAMCDSVKDPYGYGKVLVIGQSKLTALSQFVYGSGGTTSFRTMEEMASQFGVREIVVLDILDASTTVDAICLIPEEYWIREKKTQTFVYPTYEKNTINYQIEKNIGGKIHGLLSTAVLKSYVAPEA